MYQDRRETHLVGTFGTKGDKMSAQPETGTDYEMAVIEQITYRTAPETRAAIERIADMQAVSSTFRIARAARPSERLRAL